MLWFERAARGHGMPVAVRAMSGGTARSNLVGLRSVATRTSAPAKGLLPALTAAVEPVEEEVQPDLEGVWGVRLAGVEVQHFGEVRDLAAAATTTGLATAVPPTPPN